MEYENILSLNLQKDTKFHKTYYEALTQLFEREPKYQINNQTCQAKIFHFPEQKTKYLLVKDSSNVLSVYRENVSDYNHSKPFEYIKKSLKENTPFYETPILKIAPPTKVSKKSTNKNKNSPELLKIETYFEKAREILGNKWSQAHVELVAKLYENSTLTLETTTQAYTLKNFSHYLVSQGLIKNALSDTYLLGMLRPAKEKEAPADVLLNLDFFFKVSEKRKLTAKKPFVFNDLDNKLWAQTNQGVDSEINAIVLQNQNAAFYIVKHSAPETYSVYVCDLNQEKYKAQSSLKSLVEVIEKTPLSDISPIDSMMLKIENKKIKFIDYSYLECFMLDIQFTRMNLKEDLNEAPEYPIDTQSYEYLKNYYHDQFGYSEFEFLTQAFLTLGGGFEYDKKTKSFVNPEVQYLPKLLNYKQPADPKKFTTMNYCYPKEFGALNKDWTQGLEYLVFVLKRDNPTPLASKTNNKIKDVQNAITVLEKHLNKKPKAKPVEKNKIK